MSETTVLKKYDFFGIYKHSKIGDSSKGYDDDGNNYDLNEIDKCLTDRYRDVDETNKLMKLGKSIYAGITHIRCVYVDGKEPEVVTEKDRLDLKREHVWLFNIEKANVQNKAVIVMVNEDVNAGRTEYGDDPNEGAATDTIVCFNPLNGVVVIPPMSGMGISKVNKFFYHFTNRKERGLVDQLIIDDTNSTNISSLATVNELDVRVTKLVENDESYKGNMKSFNSIKNKKMALKLYGGDMIVAEVANFVKELITLSQKKKVELNKILISGEHNEENQLIDLVTHRLIASNRVDLVNGKPTIDGMMKSVLKAYWDNKTKLDISHNLKGGQGV